MFLLIGLGNPGKQYWGTRHNIGFEFIDYLVDKKRISLRDSKWQASLTKTEIGQAPVILVKPNTFMNLSGTSVARIAHFYQIETEKIIVVHDDLDLTLGRIKMVFDRGAGGHNGIRSIIEQLGTKKFVRIRVGIGRPVMGGSASDFVLSPFSQADREILQNSFSKIEDGIVVITEKSMEQAMSLLNS